MFISGIVLILWYYTTKYYFDESYMRKIITIILILTFIFGCKDEISDNEKKDAKIKLRGIAVKISGDFNKIAIDVKNLASHIEKVYQNKEEYLADVNTSKYKMTEIGQLYKLPDEKLPALYVSGFYPVNDEIKKTAYFTEGIDKYLIEYASKYKEVVQAYYNNKFSLNRIYPWFDVLAQYEPMMNIPSFNFYFLADAQHNPQKKAVWVNEPYVDPAGRGWMVSAIAPVYSGDSLEGVCGLDVTVNTITDRYIHSSENIMILDGTATVVTASESLLNLFLMPALKDHKYMETIRYDSYRKDDYNLNKSIHKNIRELADNIYSKGVDESILVIDSREYIVFSIDVKEIDWKIIYLIERYK